MTDKDQKRTNVLLESMQDDMKKILEGREATNKKLDDHIYEFKDFKKEVNFKFNTVFDEFKEVKTHLNRHDDEFKEMKNHLNHHDDEFKDVKDELRLIRNEVKEKVGRDEFIVLEKRLSKLESKVK